MFFYVGRPAFAAYSAEVASATKAGKAPVGREGLEPSYLAASAPRADVSANFTTCPFKKL